MNFNIVLKLCNRGLADEQLKPNHSFLAGSCRFLATSKRPDRSIDQDRQPGRLWFSDPALMTLPAGPAFHRQCLPASLDPSLLGDFELTSEVTPLTAFVERAQLSSIPRSASLPNQHSSDRTVSKRGPLATLR